MSVSYFCWVGPPPALPLLPSLRIWYASSLGALGVALCSLDTARPGFRHCFNFCYFGCRHGPSAQASLPLAQQGPGLPNSRQGHTAPLPERGHQCHPKVAMLVSDSVPGSLDPCDENLDSPGSAPRLLGQLHNLRCRQLHPPALPNYAPYIVWQPGENSRTLCVLVQICMVLFGCRERRVP